MRLTVRINITADKDKSTTPCKWLIAFRFNLKVIGLLKANDLALGRGLSKLDKRKLPEWQFVTCIVTVISITFSPSSTLHIPPPIYQW